MIHGRLSWDSQTNRKRAVHRVRHIVYIVGAGMTKALQATAPVPLMWDFVSVMSEYIYRDNGDFDRIILTSLAEMENAGVFEHTKNSWRELAQRVVRSDRDTEPDLTKQEADEFRRIMRERPPENIEQLLQRAVDIAADEFGAGLLPQRFNFGINEMFSRIGWNLNLTCLDRFLAKQCELPDTKHTFVSFNYDLVLDRCIQQRKDGLWNVKQGYGFEVDRFITPAGAVEHMKQFDGPGGAFGMLPSRRLDAKGDNNRAITILKPHGSLNWLLGFRENYHFIDAMPILCLDADHSITHYDRFSCQHIQLKDDLDYDLSEDSVWADAGLYLIPPTDSKSSKLQFIKNVRDQEKQAYTTADEVYVIGWSMPSTDKDQVEIISQSIQERIKPLERVTAINFNAKPEYYEELGRVFDVDDLNLIRYDKGFCEYPN